MSDRMTAAEFQAVRAAAKRSKYGNQRVTVQGVEFDSKREAMRYLLLRAREQRGEIADLKTQVAIYLEGRDGPILTPSGRQMIYLADFAYHEPPDGPRVLEDSKGMRTKEYVVKAGIVRAMGFDLREV